MWVARDETKESAVGGIAIAAIVVMALATPALGQVPSPGRVGLTVEGVNVGQYRNNVRIPADSGTLFSIVDLIGRASTPSIRGELTVDVSERQELRVVYAPLRVTGRGTPASSIVFAGGLFLPVPTEAEYQFSSYRGTWRYRVYHGDTWTWRVGATAFVRDARIALAQAGQAAEDTDVGFVPLGHVSADVRLSGRWGLSFDLDGTAAPQGRAFDFSATVNYRPVPRLTLSAGYRTIEGGADVDSVYAFAWLNAAVARVGVRL